jgi:hypothetical protein
MALNAPLVSISYAVDVDECGEAMLGCQPPKECVDTPGGIKCISNEIQLDSNDTESTHPIGQGVTINFHHASSFSFSFQKSPGMTACLLNVITKVAVAEKVLEVMYNSAAWIVLVYPSQSLGQMNAICALVNAESIYHMKNDSVPLLVYGWLRNTYTGEERYRNHILYLGFQKGTLNTSDPLLFDVVSIDGEGVNGQ